MPNLTLNDALEDYYLKKLRGKSANTQEKATQELERWRLAVSRELGPNLILTDIDDTVMTRYFNRLRARIGENTFNTYRTFNLNFWNYCKDEGWVRISPMRHVDPMKVPRKVRLHLSPQELLSMLDGAIPRDRAALAIGMNGALRAQDISALIIGNVNFINNTLAYYNKKSKKEEVLAMTADLRRELLAWLHEYARLAGVEFDGLRYNWALIPPLKSVIASGENPRQMRVMAEKHLRHPERIVHEALQRIEIPTHDKNGKSNNEGFHTLRRSFAGIVHTQAAAEGNPEAIRVAQAILGHSSQKTTEIYLNITQDRLNRDKFLSGRSILDLAVERERAANEHINDEGDEGMRMMRSA